MNKPLYSNPDYTVLLLPEEDRTFSENDFVYNNYEVVNVSTGVTEMVFPTLPHAIYSAERMHAHLLDYRRDDSHVVNLTVVDDEDGEVH